MLLDDLEKWLAAHTGLLVSRQIEIDGQARSVRDVPVASTRVDLVSSDRLARLTLWETGECDLEVLDCDLGQNIFWEHRNVSDYAELDAAFRALIAEL